MRGRPETLRDLLRRASRWKGAEPLFVDEREQLDPTRVADLVARIAAGLSERGVGRGDRVAFVVGSSARHAAFFFACAEIGAVPCALHARESAPRLADAIRWLGARLLVADADRIALADAVREQSIPSLLTISLDDAQPAGGWESFADLTAGSDDRPEIAIAPEDPAYIILSSGTTGTPKGIVHTHATALASALAGVPVYGDIGRADRTLLPMTPSFAAWVNVVLPFVASRCTLVFQTRFDPARYLEALREHRITYAALPPTLWRLALRDTDGDVGLDDLRYVFFSGEPGSPDLIAALTRAFPSASVRQAWLSSEGGCGAGIVADHRLLVHAGKATAAGLPVPGCDLRVHRLGGEGLAEESETGEIAVRSPSVTPTYWDDAELTAARLGDGWWRTGDVGHVDADGQVYVTGRTDNVINTGGVKVHAEEIESILLGHPAIRLAAVVGVPDPTWGSAIEAHVVTTSDDVDAEALLDYCRSLPTMPAFKVPKRIVLHDELPTTATGKLYRSALRRSG